MPVASLAEILEEMADQIIAAFAPVNDVDIQIEPRYVGRPTPPTIDIYHGEQGRDQQTAGMGDLFGGYFINVRARVATSDDEAQQDLLTAFLDDEDELSLAHAVCDDRTLNGLASDVDWQAVTGILPFVDGTIGCVWSFLVIPGES